MFLFRFILCPPLTKGQVTGLYIENQQNNDNYKFVLPDILLGWPLLRMAKITKRLFLQVKAARGHKTIL